MKIVGKLPTAPKGLTFNDLSIGDVFRFSPDSNADRGSGACLYVKTRSDEYARLGDTLGLRANPALRVTRMRIEPEPKPKTDTLVDLSIGTPFVFADDPIPSLCFRSSDGFFEPASGHLYQDNFHRPVMRVNGEFVIREDES